MKRKTKLKQVIILLLLVFMCAFALSNYKNYKLLKNGYSINEVKEINKNLISDDIKSLIKRNYTKDVIRIIESKKFKPTNFNNYLKLLDELGNYNDKIIDIVNEKYYKRALSKRYINYYKNNKDITSRQIVEDVNCNLDYEYYKVDYKVDLTKKYQVLVNKFYKLDKEYTPNNLVKIDKKYGRERQVEKRVYEAFIEMYNAIEKEGMGIYITSPYRSYSYQKSLYNNYAKENGTEKADTFSARAGYSEHQTALAIDITAKGLMYTKFATTKEFEWMLKNCYKYGFILRYPKDKERQTGYMFESWHYRYVGKKIAKYIHDNGITYDEYYEYFIK